MGEKPILFSAPMVRALLSGTKTQTRRVVKPQPFVDGKGLLWWHWSKHGGSARNDRPGEPSDAWLEHCPYGQSGDRLWVREAWRAFAAFNGRPPRDITAGPVWYEAQDDVPFHPTAYGKLRPGMFMPRWASRITLEITGVRVERLQAISEADAMAEGIETEGDEWRDYLMPHTQCCLTPRASYRTLWESINGAGSWDANPWVWCVYFKRVTP